MTFAYYDRLTAPEKRIYRQSDAIPSVRLPRPVLVHPLVAALAEALGREERRPVEAAAQALFDGLGRQLGVPPCRVEVLAARPHGRWGELQGLYNTAERGRAARVTLWMRTARQRRVVAFRTFLRTFLHELGHHLDYTYLRLADSFHTEGFYKRESSLFHQLVPEASESATRSSPAAGRPRPGKGAPDGPGSGEAPASPGPPARPARPERPEGADA